MTNRNFEDIDQLFREGLNPAVDPVASREGDWIKLQHRLDRHEKRKRGIFWITRLSGVAALILLFFVLRMMIPESQKQTVQQAEVQQKEQKIEEGQNQPTLTPETNELVIKKDAGSSTSLAQNKDQEEKPTEKQTVANGLVDKTTGNDTLRQDNLSLQKSMEQPMVHSEGLLSAEPDTVTSTEQKQSVGEESTFAVIQEPIDQPLPERSVRKMALSILAAPAYNGVNNLNNASLGNDFGLMISFEIAKNWSISTGGIYAKKLYDTGYRNYTPTKNIWTDAYPRYVSADCRVLDIPLNINYTFLHRKNTTMGFGSGISSYIMLSEEYRFSYYENDPSNLENYRVVNENQHWLGVVNIQANIDQRLSSRLSIGLQPYLKIPLKNIGFAGVKLQSLGMAANLSWNFNL